VPLPVLIALLIPAHEAVPVGLLVTSVGEQREEAVGSAAPVEVRAFRIIALPAASVVSPRIQAILVTLVVSIGTVAIATVIRGIIDARAFVDPITISVAITIPITITISVTATMPIAVTIAVAITVAIAIPGEVRLANQNPIALAVLIHAATTSVAVATRSSRVGIARAIPSLPVNIFVAPALPASTAASGLIATASAAASAA